MSMHRAWFPPEVHIRTGPLCSVGSRCHPVRQLLRSYGAIRLPRPRRPRLRSSLAFGLPRGECSALHGGARIRTRDASGMVDRLPTPAAGPPLEGRGPPGLLGRPLRTCRASKPRRTRRCLAQLLHAPPTSSPSSDSAPSASGIFVNFVASLHGPHVRLPTHRRCRCRHRRKADYRRGRARPSPSGFRTRWTAYEVS